MDSATLRALQAPLKERYRADPAAALTPIGAVGRFSDGGVTCTVAGFAGPVRAGLHRATGGDGSDACSADMLLEALLAYAGVTLRSVATSMGVELGQVSLRAEGTFDARGTLGIDRAAPVGAQDVVVTIEVDGPERRAGRAAARPSGADDREVLRRRPEPEHAAADRRPAALLNTRYGRRSREGVHG